MTTKRRLEYRVSEAVKYFWQVRERQQEKQVETGKNDQGTRGSATGGNHLNGFVNLFRQLFIESGIPENSVYHGSKAKMYLPGFFRATKQWDMLVVHNNHLIAAIELKSQVGSFGNNHNNRVEEALGNATDFWTAFREGAFSHAPRPWLGYFVLLEDCEKSTAPVRVYEPHFSVMNEFRQTSYADRYDLFCKKAIRERCYDGACIVLSSRKSGNNGKFRELSPNTGIKSFVAAMTTHSKTALATLGEIEHAGFE